MGGLPDGQLVVVGGEREALQRLVALAREAAPGRVHFTGLVPHAAVPFHLAAGDVIVTEGAFAVRSSFSRNTMKMGQP